MTFDTVDICPGLPRSWRWRDDTIDPIVEMPLKDFVEQNKHKPGGGAIHSLIRSKGGRKTNRV